MDKWELPLVEESILQQVNTKNIPFPLFHTSQVASRISSINSITIVAQ